MTFRVVRDNGMSQTTQYPGWQEDGILVRQEYVSAGPAWGNINFTDNALDTWLGNTYVGLFPQWVQDLLLEGGIPVTVRSTGTVEIISRKVFVPSLMELGLTSPNVVPIGAPLNPDMFSNNDARIARGIETLSPVFHTSRNPHTTTSNTVFGISVTGIAVTATITALNSGRIVPFMVLPPTTKFTTIGDTRVLIEEGNDGVAADRIVASVDVFSHSDVLVMHLDRYASGRVFFNINNPGNHWMLPLSNQYWIIPDGFTPAIPRYNGVSFPANAHHVFTGENYPSSLQHYHLDYSGNLHHIFIPLISPFVETTFFPVLILGILTMRYL